MIGPLPREDTPAMQELTAQPFWVAWELVQRSDKTTKEPKSISRHPVDITSPASWNAYDDIASKVINLQWVSGLGFCFAEENDYCGIDIDKCIDPKTKIIQKHALDTMKQFNSYAEYSVSGTGLHIIIKGKIEGKGKRHGGYEVYDKGRFFVMTGDHIEGTPDNIETRQLELDKFLRDNFKPQDKPAPTEWKSVADFVFDDTATAPHEKHKALLQNSKDYKRCWARTFTENEMSDRTLSGYDYKLIYILMEVEWKPQEIYDTVIDFRRHWCKGDRDKFLKVAPKDQGGRDDYFINTFNKVAARVKSGLPQPFYDLSEAIEAGGDIAKDKFNEITGLNIEGVIQRGLPSTYLIKVGGAAVPVGGAKELFSPRAVECALYDYQGKGIPPKTKKMWHEVCELLFTFAEKDMGQEFDKNHHVRSIVKEYIDKKGMARGDNWKEAALEGLPFEKHAFIYFNLSNLRQHMNFTMDIRMDPMAITKDLGVAGFKYQNISIKTDNVKTSRGFWTMSEKEVRSEHLPCDWTAGDGEDDLPGGAGNERSAEVREQIDHDMQLDESGSA